LILLLAGVAYVVFYKKGNGSGNGSGNGNGKPENPDFQVDPSKFPSAGVKPSSNGTMDIPAVNPELRFL
jgi:hypothetical protein